MEWLNVWLPRVPSIADIRHILGPDHRSNLNTKWHPAPCQGPSTSQWASIAELAAKTHSLIGLLNWIILTLPDDWSLQGSTDQANSDISFLNHSMFEMPQEVLTIKTRTTRTERNPWVRGFVSWTRDYKLIWWFQRSIYLHRKISFRHKLLKPSKAKFRWLDRCKPRSFNKPQSTVVSSLSWLRWDNGAKVDTEQELRDEGEGPREWSRSPWSQQTWIWSPRDSIILLRRSPSSHPPSFVDCS